MTFGLMCVFSENFVLSVSHDKAVHAQGSFLARIPAVFA